MLISYPKSNHYPKDITTAFRMMRAYEKEADADNKRQPFGYRHRGGGQKHNNDSKIESGAVFGQRIEVTYEKEGERNAMIFHLTGKGSKTKKKYRSEWKQW